MTIGESIQKYRKAKNMSQEDLGEKLLLTRQTISLWEKDQTAPTLDNLMRLKEIFGVSMDELIGGDEKAEMKLNKDSLDTICAALTYAMGIEPPEFAAEKNGELANYIDKIFQGEKADRVVMYNPDAIAQWIYEKYPDYFDGLKDDTEKRVYLSSVLPSVTPVCFGTMYSGAQPEIHGIRKYEKPVITIDTIFDALIRAGKKVALITYGGASLGKIFLERDMDYFHFDEGGIASVNAKMVKVILEDKYDFIVIYNGNYDSVMHKNGPESAKSLAELRLNVHIFSMLSRMIKENWKHHNTLVGFAMDHGCHEIDGGCGSHGLDMTEDLNIVHLYKGYPKEEK